MPEAIEGSVVTGGSLVGIPLLVLGQDGNLYVARGDTTTIVSTAKGDAAALEITGGSGGGGGGNVNLTGINGTAPGSGNPLFVDVTNFPATQPVSGTVSVNNFPATQPVSGTVNVGNFPGTQPVSGTVSVGNFPATQAINVTQVAGAAISESNPLPARTSAVKGFTALSSPPSNTNANSDTSLTFSSDVYHLLIQNNTSAVVYLDLDTAATQGSPELAAGQTWFLDVHTSVLHVFTVAAQPVNAASGIVIRGWA